MLHDSTTLAESRAQLTLAGPRDARTAHHFRATNTSAQARDQHAGPRPHPTSGTRVPRSRLVSSRAAPARVCDINPLLHVRVRDSLVEGRGSGQVSLLSAFTVAADARHRPCLVTSESPERTDCSSVCKTGKRGLPDRVRLLRLRCDVIREQLFLALRAKHIAGIGLFTAWPPAWLLPPGPNRNALGSPSQWRRRAAHARRSHPDSSQAVLRP